MRYAPDRFLLFVVVVGEKKKRLWENTNNGEILSGREDYFQ
jgi:hypothetical protein